MMQSISTQVKDLMMHARASERTAQTDAHQQHQHNIVLVHGLGMSGRYMMPTAERLIHFANVYVPDLPGFGQSDKPSRALTIAELADYLAWWMDAINIERAVFVGNSFGTQIIIELATRFPERVERAVLIAPTIDARARVVSRQLARLLLDATREPLSLTPIAVSDYLRAGLKRGARTLRYAIADCIEEKLPRIHAPVLVVRGGRDPIVSQAWAAEVARLSAGGRLKILPHAAHAVNYNSPKELARLIIEFVNEQTEIER
jgi:2-hydroxy-6-oxonona-2,4-dienedioate hydrolase